MRWLCWAAYKGLSSVNCDTLESLLTTLDVKLSAFAVCEIGSTWRLKVDPLDMVVCHFVVRGHGFLEFGETRTPISAGSIIVVPPGVPKSIAGDGPICNEVDAPDSCDSYEDGFLRFRARGKDAELLLGCASLQATFGGGIGMFDALAEPLVAAMGGNRLFTAGFEELLNELTESKVGSGVIAECLMKQAVVFLLREQMSSRQSMLLDHFGDPRLLRAVAAMLRTPGGAHSIVSLAELSGMSRSAFMKRFAEQYRTTPGDFLQGVRMRSAATLLITSPMPIKCLSGAVGYASRSQFSRAFKCAFGLDPTAYRELHGNSAVVQPRVNSNRSHDAHLHVQQLAALAL